MDANASGGASAAISACPTRRITCKAVRFWRACCSPLLAAAASRMYNMPLRKLVPGTAHGLQDLQMRSRLATTFSVTILGVVALAILSSLVTWYAAWRVNIRLEEAIGTFVRALRG